MIGLRVIGLCVLAGFCMAPTCDGPPKADDPEISSTTPEAQLERYCMANDCFKGLRACISKEIPSNLAQPARCSFINNAKLSCWGEAGNCGSCNQGDPGRLKKLILRSFECSG